MCLFLTMTDFNYVQQSDFYLALNIHIVKYIYVHIYTHIHIVEYTILLIEYTTLINNATCISV